jgi:hypothetical protein
LPRGAPKHTLFGFGKGNESRLLIDDEEKFIRNGEPTEAAIRVLVEKLGCPDEAVNQPLASVSALGRQKSPGWIKNMEGSMNYWLLFYRLRSPDRSR